MKAALQKIIANRLLTPSMTVPLPPGGVPSLEGWKINALTSPFWQNHRPVEVRYLDGSTKTMSCPRCSKWQSHKISHWRIATT